MKERSFVFLCGIMTGFVAMALIVALLGHSDKCFTQYNKGFEAGKNYTPETMKMIDSLTIPEFTAKERRIISQFMLIIKKASEVKE